MLRDFVREIGSVGGPEVDYSICTLVNDPAQYGAMVDSFVAAGFAPGRCEYLYADNIKANTADGYRGLNRLIFASRGRYVVLVHQDVLVLDPIWHLDAILAGLDRTAPNWAVAGNAGFDAAGSQFHTRITERDRVHNRLDHHPVAEVREVVSLDENFVILRRDALLGFSHDLAGFHFYATDLVMQARLRGRSAWVVDFHVEHLGRGKIDATVIAARDAFEQKYARFMKAFTLRTPINWIGVGRRTIFTVADDIRLKDLAQGGWRSTAMRGIRALMQGPRLFRLVMQAGSGCRLDGLKFRIPKDAPFAAKVAMKLGVYEEHERRLLARYLPADLPAVELGGAYGVVSSLLRRKVDATQKVIVIEANPAVMRVCTDNVARNRLAGETVFLNRALAYGGAETVRFTVTADVHTSHVTQSDESGTVAVPATTLAAVLRDQGVGGNYALVCDIEGYEFDLFEHEQETLSRCAVAVIEVHPSVFHEQKRTVQQFRGFVARAGLQIVDVSGTVIVARRA